MNDLGCKEFQFECVKCVNCCTDKTKGYVYLEINEIFKISKHLGISIDELLDKYIEYREEIIDLDDGEFKFNVFSITQKNGSCIFLRGGNCNIYEFRPFQCRQYPFWNDIFNNKDNFKKYKVRCNGFGKGRKYTEDEIKNKLNKDAKFQLKLIEDSKVLGSIKIEKLINSIKEQIKLDKIDIDDASLELVKKKLLAQSLKKLFLNRNNNV